MNVVAMTGRLGGDPERHVAASGKTVVSFRMAVDNPYNRDQPDWVRVKVFGNSAEPVARIAHKGMLVGVTGRLSVSRYEHKDGGTREDVSVIADRVDFLQSKDRDVPREYGPAAAPAPRSEHGADQRHYAKKGELPLPPAPEYNDEDVPF